MPITLGKPMVLHTNEAILPSMIAVWFVVNNVPGVLKLLQTRAGQLISNTGFEVFRYHVLANCSDLASKSLPPLSNGQLSVALTGPLLAGLLGGCGGAFMPLSNGLKAVEGKEIPWRIQSAAVMAVWHHLLMHDSAVRNSVSASVPFLADTDTVRACCQSRIAGRRPTARRLPPHSTLPRSNCPLLTPTHLSPGRGCRPRGAAGWVSRCLGAAGLHPTNSTLPPPCLPACLPNPTHLTRLSYVLHAD